MLFNLYLMSIGIYGNIFWIIYNIEIEEVLTCEKDSVQIYTGITNYCI